MERAGWPRPWWMVLAGALAVGCTATAPAAVPPPTASRPAAVTTTGTDGSGAAPIDRTIKMAYPGKVGFNHSLTYLGWDLMREAGWKIEEVQYSNIPAAVQGVALKEADCGWLSDSARLAAMDKEPGLKLKGLFEGAGDPWVIVARSTIADFSQLNDRPLAQGVPGQINDFLLDKSVDKYGVHPQIIRFNDSEQRAQALIAGQVDSGLVSIDDVVTLERARPGQFRVLIRYKDELPDIAGNYFACSGAFIDQYPDAVQAMVDQQILAYRRAYDEPSWYLTQVKTKITEADDASLKARYDAFIENRIWNPNGNMSPRTLEATFNAYKEGRIFKGDITIADWSDRRFIENTLKKLGEYQFKT